MDLEMKEHRFGFRNLDRNLKNEHSKGWDSSILPILRTKKKWETRPRGGAQTLLRWEARRTEKNQD